MSNNTENILSQGLLTVENLLQDAILQGTFNEDFLSPAFGTSVNSASLEKITLNIVQSGLSSLAQVEIRSASDLGGARGVYAATTETVYLAAEFLTNASQEQVVEVILEEFGHAIDAEINVTDSAGDEGAIFSALMLGKTLTEAELTSLHAENDTVKITIDGQVITAEASTLTVTTKNDLVDAFDGVTSLREALTAAKNGDTITFASSLSGQTITLNSELAINKSITINGDLDNNNSPDITISGNNLVRLFNINNGVVTGTSAVLDVTFDGLMMENGKQSFGGAIYNNENLTITNSTLAGNSSMIGGAIYNSFFAELTLSNTTFSNNYATSGGAILNDDQLILDNVTFVNNSATNGGAIFNYGTITSTEATLSDNSATNGGAIFNYGTVNLTEATLSGNEASLSGGAILNYFTLNLDKSTVSDNSATVGGAIYNSDTANLTNSTLSGNSATTGGAIYDSSFVNLLNSTLVYNSASAGGGIFTKGFVDLKNNLISGNSADYGAEIFVVDLEGFVFDDYNLFGDSSKTDSEAFENFTPFGTYITATSDGTTPTDLEDIINVNLANNGGPTKTYALVSGSPALNAGVDTGLREDQRGETRPYGGGFDIGAYEVQSNAIPVITNGQIFTINENSTNGTNVGTVLATDTDGDTLSNWTITDGNTDSAFAINANTGVITVTNSLVLDYEVQTSFILTLTVSDGFGTSNPRNITINLNDINELVYTSGDDTVRGTAAADNVDLLAGNDRFSANGGDDTVYGNDGNDTIYGRTGDDILYGGAGKDVLYGNNDEDELYGNGGNDFLYGGKGDDVIFGGLGRDRLYGNDDDDDLYGEDGNDFLYGGNGDDRLVGGLGNDILYGRAGADVFVLGSGEGQDQIRDYEVEFDNIEIDADLTITLEQSGADVLIKEGDDILATVFNVTTSDLDYLV